MKINLNKILLNIIIALSCIIVFCTVTALLSGKAKFGFAYRKKDPSGVAQLKVKNNLQEFKELGTLRALTKASENSSIGVNLVVTPWLCYELKDSAFTEELSHKKKSITTIFLNYFASFTQQELFKIGEKNVKEQLLQKVNQDLVFGKIQAIYFDDYIFLE